MKKTVKIMSLFMVMILVVMSLTGCNETKKAETAVSNMFNEFKNTNIDAVSQYLVGETDEFDDEYTKIMMENLFKKLDYSIISSELQEDKSVLVKTQITAADMKVVMSDLFKEYMEYAFSSGYLSGQVDEAAMLDKIKEVMVKVTSNPDLATVTNEVDIKVSEVDGEWKITSDEAFIDALFGGLKEATEGMEGILG